ncbi:hypothetical protein ACOMHN_038876 [Nucella lapillus]
MQTCFKGAMSQPSPESAERSALVPSLCIASVTQPAEVGSSPLTPAMTPDPPGPPLTLMLTPARGRRPRAMIGEVSSTSSFTKVRRTDSSPLDSPPPSDVFLSPLHPALRPRCHSESRMADVAYDCYLSKSCVSFLHQPSVFNLCRLRKKLGGSDRRWMEDFLENRGLELLFECLGQLSRQGGGFQALVMRLECVLCIRTCINSRIGLDYLILGGVYASKFSLGGCMDVQGLMV